MNSIFGSVRTAGKTVRTGRVDTRQLLRLSIRARIPRVSWNRQHRTPRGRRAARRLVGLPWLTQLRVLASMMTMMMQ